MPTYSPEQALARPTSRAPLWGEGLLAAALWLLGGLFTLTRPTPGGAGRLAKAGRWRNSPSAAACCCWR